MRAHILEKRPDPTLKVRNPEFPQEKVSRFNSLSLQLNKKKKKLVIKNLKITFRGGIMRVILKITMRESDFFLTGVSAFTKRRSMWDGGSSLSPRGTS
jgi:hypothetical protein